MSWLCFRDPTHLQAKCDCSHQVQSLSSRHIFERFSCCYQRDMLAWQRWNVLERLVRRRIHSLQHVSGGDVPEKFWPNFWGDRVQSL